MACKDVYNMMEWESEWLNDAMKGMELRLPTLKAAQALRRKPLVTAVDEAFGLQLKAYDGRAARYRQEFRAALSERAAELKSSEMTAEEQRVRLSVVELVRKALYQNERDRSEYPPTVKEVARSVWYAVQIPACKDTECARKEEAEEMRRVAEFLAPRVRPLFEVEPYRESFSFSPTVLGRDLAPCSALTEEIAAAQCRLGIVPPSAEIAKRYRVFGGWEIYWETTDRNSRPIPGAEALGILER